MSLIFFLNLLVSVVNLMLSGKEFQAAGPAWLKQRSQNLVRLRRLMKSAVSADLRPGRRLDSAINSTKYVVHVQCGFGTSVYTMDCLAMHELHSLPSPMSMNIQWRFWGLSFFFLGGGTVMATLSSGGHTTNTFVLNYRVCNRLCQIINT